LFFVAAIAEAGMSVAFPIGGGIAWILGIVVNYVVMQMDGKTPSDRPGMLWFGVALIILAIFFSGKAYQRLSQKLEKTSVRGIMLSLVAGLFIAFFYGFVVKSLDGDFVAGGTGNLTPSTAIFLFSVGVIICTVLFYLFIMRPLKIGNPGTFSEFFGGNAKSHFAGFLGGLIWALGIVVSFMAVSAANPAISYALSNAAPVVAILWGVFVWKEFNGAPKGTNTLLLIMFSLYIIGLLFITFSNA
jgi:glucose uptake protein